MGSTFEFKKNIKLITLVMMLIGLIAGVVGFMDHDTHGQRGFVNLLINGFFFFSIGLGALFFIALQYAAEVAWPTVLKRVFEAVMMFMPIGALILLIVFGFSSAHISHIYHWMDPELTDPTSHHYDAIIDGKSGYLNNGFFWLRTLVYLGSLVGFGYVFRKRSIQEDSIKYNSVAEEKAGYFRNQKLSAIFLVVFAVFSSTLAWDWIMSIDPHWFSTLFGWYTFSGMWVSALIIFNLLTIYLKSKGYLPNVNENHIHDLGKWMFALSILWAYLWFSQYLLIWYSNIPEEVTYYKDRFGDYKVLFLTVFFVNLVLPLVILMSRPAKRNNSLLVFVGVIIFIGHWLDVFLMVAPGTLHHKGTVGLVEIGMMIGFLGLFIYSVLTSLTKAPLEVKNHPYLDESIHHHY